MTLAEINRRIALQEPAVELVRGEGYHYYTFDLTIISARPDRVIFETESYPSPYTNRRPAADWIADGIAFGRRVRTEQGLMQRPLCPHCSGSELEAYLVRVVQRYRLGRFERV